MSGYTKRERSLDNELLHRDFTQNERKCIEFILRLSQGCGIGKFKNYCIIHNKKDFEACGIPENTINRSLKKLIVQNVIIEKKDKVWLGTEQNVYVYSINLNINTWETPYIKNIEESKKKYNHLIKTNLSSINKNKSKELANYFRIEAIKKIIEKGLEQDYIEKTAKNMYKKDSKGNKKLKVNDYFVEKSPNIILIGHEKNFDLNDLNRYKSKLDTAENKFEFEYLLEIIVFADLLAIKGQEIFPHEDMTKNIKALMISYNEFLFNSRIETVQNIDKIGFNEFIKKNKINKFEDLFNIIKNNRIFFASGLCIPAPDINKLYFKNFEPELEKKYKDEQEISYFFEKEQHFKNEKIKTFSKKLFKFEFNLLNRKLNNNEIEIKNFDELNEKFQVFSS